AENKQEIHHWRLRPAFAATQHFAHPAFHEYVCRIAFAAKNAAYHRHRPSNASTPRLLTLVADATRGDSNTKIVGDAPCGRYSMNLKHDMLALAIASICLGFGATAH